jgi:hypothetical protein
MAARRTLLSAVTLLKVSKNRRFLLGTAWLVGVTILGVIFFLGRN